MICSASKHNSTIYITLVLSQKNNFAKMYKPRGPFFQNLPNLLLIVNKKKKVKQKNLLIKSKQ